MKKKKSKRPVLLALAAVVLVAGAGAGWWYWRARDPLANARALLAKNDVRGALLVLRTAVRDHPDNAEAHFRLGTLQLMTGDPIAAERELKAAQEHGFVRATALAELDRAYLAQGKFAAIVAEPVPDGAAPADATAILVARGLAQAGLKQFDAAEATLAQAVKLKPDAADPPLAQARVAALQGDHATALQAVDRSLAIDGKRSDALLLKAQLLASRGERDTAITALDAALAGAPGLISARLLRADLLLAIGQTAKARPDVEAALAAEPKNVTALFLRGVLQAEGGDAAAANATLAQLSGQLGQFPRGYYVLATVKEQLREFAQATDAAERYLSHNPRDPAAIKLFARITLQAGYPARALDVLQRAREGGLLDAGILDLMGHAFAATGQTEQAQRSFEEAVALPAAEPPAAGLIASGDAVPAAAQSAGARRDARVALILAAIDGGQTEAAATGIAALRQVAGEGDLAGELDGMLKLSQFDLKGARTAFAAALAAHPDSLRAKLNLAKTAALQGERAEAAALLGGILATQPTSPAALFALVPMLLQDGEPARALAVMAAAHDAAPTNVALTAMLSELYLRAGKAEQALALDQAPGAGGSTGQGSPPALLAARARAEAALGRTADAAETYRQILAAVPASRDARVQLATLLRDSDPAAAARVLRDGLQLAPGDAALLNALVGLELKRGGTEAALAAAATLAADPANQPAANTLKGDVLMQARQFDAAAAAYAEAGGATPSGVLTLRTAQARQAAGHADQAAQLLRDWLAKQPEDWNAVGMLAELDITAGRLDAAAAGLQRLLAKQPNVAVALNNLAWIEQQRGNAKQARGYALRAFFLDSTPQVTDTLGWILAQGDDPADGIMLLRRALAAAPKDPQITFHLADALGRTDRRGEALELLKPLLAGDAKFADQTAAQQLLARLSQP